ncbi:MAG: family oxidoreductase [Gemmatimonadetes bacterium]|nr:family oxidoreductase [Gemmatimonadota bacterium]
MQTFDTDVLVIGTGFGAAAPALRLAEAGAGVIMLEKGPRVGVGDFRQTQDPRYITKYLKALSGDHVSLTYAEALGGGSGFYEMVSLRAPSLAFAQRDGTGRGLWPAGLDRATLDPWYDVAEDMLGVTQIAIEDIPRSGLVFSLLLKTLGYSCERARYAVRNCLGSGFCVTGCIYGSKQSLHLNYLPQAEAAGARIECDREAVLIRSIRTRSVEGSVPLDRVPFRYVVETRSRTGGPSIRYRARLVVLGGGTVGTAGLLLRSREQLPRLSAQVGRNLGINSSVKVVGLLGDHLPDGDMFTGRSHPGMISYHFLESHGITLAAVKALPLQIVTAARLRLDGDAEDAWWGQDQQDLMARFRRRALAIASFGLTPPSGEIHLAPDGTPVVTLRPTPALERYERETRRLVESIFERNDCRVIRSDWLDRSGRPHDGLFFSTAHQTGSARMADGPGQGVVDAAGEVFGHAGLYVSDGAAIPSSLAVNTSLTILANAERIAAGIVARHGLGQRQKPGPLVAPGATSLHRSG